MSRMVGSIGRIGVEPGPARRGLLVLLQTMAPYAAEQVRAHLGSPDSAPSELAHRDSAAASDIARGTTEGSADGPQQGQGHALAAQVATSPSRL